MQLDDSEERLRLLKRLSAEFEEANRPLIGVHIYQQELSATLDFAGACADPRLVSADNLPEFTLAAELEFMREANLATGERPCRMGAKCDTVRVSAALGMQPWTMRESLTPDEQALFASCAELPTVNAGLCLFCLKKNAFMHLATQMFMNQDARVIIQPYRNKYDTAGEFAADMCIKPSRDKFYGIIAPFARHDTCMYTMELDAATGLHFAAFTDDVYFRPAPAACA
jgi:hypothetical protein